MSGGDKHVGSSDVNIGCGCLSCRAQALRSVAATFCKMADNHDPEGPCYSNLAAAAFDAAESGVDVVLFLHACGEAYKFAQRVRTLSGVRPEGTHLN